MQADTKKASPNERLHVGIIGVAGQGAEDEKILRDADVAEEFSRYLGEVGAGGRGGLRLLVAVRRFYEPQFADVS